MFSRRCVLSRALGDSSTSHSHGVTQNSAVFQSNFPGRRKRREILVAFEFSSLGPRRYLVYLVMFSQTANLPYEN
jgi:hypothetical protein